MAEVAVGLQVVSLLYGASMNEKNSQANARAEKQNAANRSIQRKRNLVASLASQRVAQAASGTQGGKGTSWAAIMDEDVRKFKEDEKFDMAVTTQRVNQINQNAQNMWTYSLLSSGAEIASYKRKRDQVGEVK